MSNDTSLEDNKAKEAQEAAEDIDVSELEVSGNVNEDELWEMIRAGLWYGRKKNRTHPKMRQYIFANRNGIEIIDLAKTASLLESALEFLKGVAAKGGKILFVGTQPSAKKPIEEIAKRFDEPYVVNRWLGGTLTNFSTLSKRVDHFKKLKTDQASGALEKYTKKERSDFNKEIERLATLFSGVENMSKLPNALFVANASIHSTPIREAKKMKIPIVGLISTDTNPEVVNYPIPGNDLSPASISWILGRIEKALEEGKAQAVVEPKQKQ